MPNTQPSAHFLEVVKTVKRQANGPVRIAEFGVDQGATTREILRLLTAKDILDLYDRETCPLAADIDQLSESFDATIKFHANTLKIFDSYAWTVGMQLMGLRQSYGEAAIWDAVYLDGAHTFPVDAAATCCIKEMIKPGGMLVFDDVKWTLSASPTCNNPEFRSRFTDEQMDFAHVNMIIELFVRSDSRFYELTGRDEPRAVFRRLSSGS